MEIILLEKIRNLGGIGTNAVVRPGYARNYLIPYGKAVLANKANLAKFEKMRHELEAREAKAIELANERAKTFDGLTLTIAAKATEDGKLFGSVNIGAIADAIRAKGISIDRQEIDMPKGAIRRVGEYELTILLHSDLNKNIKLQVTALT